MNEKLPKIPLNAGLSRNPVKLFPGLYDLTQNGPLSRSSLPLLDNARLSEWSELFCCHRIYSSDVVISPVAVIPSAHSGVVTRRP